MKRLSRMCSATSQRKKKDSAQPSQPLSPKGDICNVFALQASAGKGGQHTPESCCCPARDTPAPLPARGLRRHEVLLVTSPMERDTKRCSSSSAEKMLAHPSPCWPWYNKLENFSVLMKKKRKGKNRNFTGRSFHWQDCYKLQAIMLLCFSHHQAV